MLEIGKSEFLLYLIEEKRLVTLVPISLFCILVSLFTGLAGYNSVLPLLESAGPFPHRKLIAFLG